MSASEGRRRAAAQARSEARPAAGGAASTYLESLNRREAVALLAGGALCASCAGGGGAPGAISAEPPAPPAPIATIPFRLDYAGRLVVEASLGGFGPLDFVVDTAATASVVFQNLADRAAFEPSGEPPATVFGLSGIRSAATYRVGDLRVGGLALVDQVSPVLPDWLDGLATPQGVLGLDYFAETLAVFNYGSRVIELYDAAADRRALFSSDQGAGWSRARLALSTFGVAARPLHLVEVDFGRARSIALLLDTGANATACNFAAAEFLRVLPVRARDPETAAIADIHGRRVDSLELTVPGLSISGARLSTNSVYITDAPFFADVGYENRPFGVVGIDSLRRQDFAIDFLNADLYLRPAAAGAQPTGDATGLG